MTTDELIGFIAAFCAALSFGSYGVPMKGEAATRVDVDPLVFQSYKAFAVLLISSILIYCNNILADEENDHIIDNANYNWTFHKWSFSDFTPWAFLSAILWVPGGTAGVYAVRRAGLAISVGIWSCVIVIISFIWGVLIFGEKQKSGALGAVKAVSVLCIGLCGIAYFSSSEPESKKKVDSRLKEVIDETTPLSSSGGDDTTSEGEDQVSLDLESFPHCGQPPHSHQTLHFHLPPLISKRTIHVPKYHLGLFFAFLNGLLAATIMIPLHYAPPHSTQGIGYSMSFGIAAMIVVLFAWLLRWMVCALQCRSVVKGYQSLPSFHFKDMLRPGMLAGLLYSIGNLSGIVSIQKLGNFMGYSLNQSSMIVSGLWGIFYYKEIPGFKNILGFISSSVIVFVGILLMGRDHQANHFAFALAMEARLDPFNKPNRSTGHLIDIDVTMTVQSAVERSPFLRPSNPRLIKKTQQSQITKTQERKSSLLGAYTNLCNVTMGAGIVGMPYAIKEAGLVPGTVMIIICAFLTDYSLRQLISVGKVADVNSYETLMEASFGRPGFIFLSVNMFLLSLGSMIAYLIIIKDTLPVLLQVAPDDEDTKRMIMFISSLFIILPLSMQRDISDLEKTSKFNVILNTIMVSLVAGFSPIKESVSASGGIMQLLSDEKILDISTFFIGFGVCSFAFVCQDSSFIIAGSMSKPTKFRWKKVTQGAMLTCVILELTMGVSGYLAYQKNAVGNILNNMNTHHWSGVASRSILCATMFFAYPINLYIGRHACMVLFFKGVSAHEGDDARVLARRDRRIILTLVLYISSLIPAIFLEKTGNVLAATGAIGGSSLAYIGPGASFLAVWGHLFLDLVRSRWHDPSRRCYGFPRKDGQQNETAIEANEETSIRDVFLWFALGMPIWCSFARIGEKQLAAHFEREMLISPGIIKPRRVSVNPIRTGTPMVHTQLIPPSKLIPGGSLETSSLLDPNSATIYGSSQDNPQDKEMQPMDRIDSFTSVEVKIEMDKTVPTIMEFWVAIGYIILGLVAMIFGLGSIIVQH